MYICTVIIPVFNKWELTRDCLTSLAATAPAESLRVIVADNASSDETAQACPVLGRELFGSAFQYLRFEKNRNFGPACNAAAKLADTDLLFFLNNDTVCSPDWMPPLVEALDNPRTVGVGPLLTYPDDTVQHLGIAFWPAGETVGHYLRHIPATHLLARRRRRFKAITAAALMMERRRFLEVGGFCEEFINGFEDVDLGLRLTSDGSHMTVIPESRVTHLESQTPNRHEGEDINRVVLSRRCELKACMDLDVLTGRDGLILKVDPDLHAMVTVSEKRDLELLLQFKKSGDNRQKQLCSLLQEEPLWEKGYLFLSDVLEKRGELLEALRTSLWGSCLIPSLRLAENSLRLAERQGTPLPGIREQVEKSYAVIRTENRSRLRKLTAALQRSGRSGLIPLYEKAAREADAIRAAMKSTADR